MKTNTLCLITLFLFLISCNKNTKSIANIEYESTFEYNHGSILKGANKSKTQGKLGYPMNVQVIDQIEVWQYCQTEQGLNKYYVVAFINNKVTQIENYSINQGEYIECQKCDQCFDAVPDIIESLSDVKSEDIIIHEIDIDLHISESDLLNKLENKGSIVLTSYFSNTLNPQA